MDDALKPYRALENRENAILIPSVLRFVNTARVHELGLNDWITSVGDTVEVPFRAPTVPQSSTASNDPTEYTISTKPEFHNRTMQYGSVTTHGGEIVYLDGKGGGQIISRRPGPHAGRLDPRQATPADEDLVRKSEAQGWYISRRHILGLCSVDAATVEQENSDFFSTIGISGSRVLAIVELPNIPHVQHDGTYKLDTPPKTHGDLAIMIREFAFPHRMHDVVTLFANNQITDREFLTSIESVFGEFNSLQEYLQAFASRLGMHIATVHNNKRTYNAMTLHNVLPNAQFVDSADAEIYTDAPVPTGNSQLDSGMNELFRRDMLIEQHQPPLSPQQKFYAQLVHDHRHGLVLLDQCMKNLGKYAVVGHEKKIYNEYISAYAQTITLSGAGARWY
jgi:hypothetical protein